MAVRYTLSFRNGAQIELEIANPGALLTQLRSAGRAGASITTGLWSPHWDVVLNVADLTFAVPSTMVVRGGSESATREAP